MDFGGQASFEPRTRVDVGSVKIHEPPNVEVGDVKINPFINDVQVGDVQIEPKRSEFLDRILQMLDEERVNERNRKYGTYSQSK
jgi:hypothetical protein